jgi:hypothetical protein
MTVPFDAQKVQLVGQPVALIDGLMQSASLMQVSSPEWASSRFPHREICYSPPGALQRLRLHLSSAGIGRGRKLNSARRRADFVFPHLSPDGQRIAIAKQGDTSRASDIWVIDSNTGNATRLRKARTTIQSGPADGKRILYAGGPGLRQLMSIAADGSGAPETAMTGKEMVVPVSATRSLLVYLENRDGKYEIWTRPLSGRENRGATSSPKFSKLNAELSPDGHWRTSRTIRALMKSGSKRFRRGKGTGFDRHGSCAGTKRPRAVLPYWTSWWPICSDGCGLHAAYSFLKSASLTKYSRGILVLAIRSEAMTLRPTASTSS